MKVHGLGNDFILLDGVGSSLPPRDYTELSITLNHRRFGIGGDGLILMEPGTDAPFRMRMFNPDGSESEMCGNGIRCFAKLLADRRYVEAGEVSVETGAGVLTVEIEERGWVRVGMGSAKLTRSEIPMLGDPDAHFVNEPVTSEAGEYCGTAVSMGNPHLVIFVPEVAAVPVERVGPILELNPLFPNRVNVHFVQILDEGHLIQRTWERGAGCTLACGTGACAVAIAGFLTGRSARQVEVSLPGGTLEIEYREDGQVFMTGPAETVFEGEWFEAS